jgi:phosphate transport system ATP-binding protein
MVFQKPNPFPSLSVFENVASGLRIRGILRGAALRAAVEQALVEAQLWDEVKDSLHRPATRLSGGQQQRLCIARALALRPPYLVLDEPTSALDPISTAKIEDLLLQLKAHQSIVLVTHNLAQAKRIADQVAFFLNGRIIESGATAAMFSNAKSKETRDYVEGRFG